MELLKTQVLPQTVFYPEAQKIFRVFSMPLDKIKVVALGQDPYPGPGQANGLAFAINKGVPAPKSLQIIKNEVINSKVERDSSVNVETDSWNELIHWHRQGVFLLNAALTVETKNPGSHVNQWAWFTREVVDIISRQGRHVWLLWGGKAQGFMDFIWEKVVYYQFPDGVDGTQLMAHNVVLKCDHPAAETYNAGVSKNKFSGSNTFLNCNKALKQQGKNIINW